MLEANKIFISTLAQLIVQLPCSHGFMTPEMQTRAHPVVIYSIIHASINIKVFSVFFPPAPSSPTANGHSPVVNEEGSAAPLDCVSVTFKIVNHDFGKANFSVLLRFDLANSQPFLPLSSLVSPLKVIKVMTRKPF
jgi:hypothetical protein